MTETSAESRLSTAMSTVASALKSPARILIPAAELAGHPHQPPVWEIDAAPSIELRRALLSPSRTRKEDPSTLSGCFVVFTLMSIFAPLAIAARSTMS